jgi:RNA polymerase sigma factor (sigma-70 family)
LARESIPAIWQHVATLFRFGTAAGLTDGSLLDRFRSGPADLAEAAFGVLVERHGSMVMDVCRQILGDRHDAEDAAQAAFLVLAQHARSIKRRESIASWLYGVAMRVAAQARRDALRRRARELRSTQAAMAIRRGHDGNPQASASESARELHEELGRLPERFRLPILLCHLQGLTYAQAAQQLGCPVRTVQSRLARGHRRLRNRLTRRGARPGPAVVPLARLLNPDAARAAVSPSWKPATVAALAQGVARAMILHRLMKSSAFLLLIGAAAAAVGVTMLAPSAPAQDTPPARADRNDHGFRVTMPGGATIEVAAGAWKTEVTNDGRGGVGLFSNGHKFTFGKLRPYTAYGRSMTVFAVAHNYFGQDRRIVAVDRDGNPHPAFWNAIGSDGDKRWVIDLIDAEFSLPPEQIREFQVQFRPFEEAEIRDIALYPNPKPIDSEREPSPNSAGAGFRGVPRQ